MRKYWGTSMERLLLGRVKHRKLVYFGHVVRHVSLEKDIIIGVLCQVYDAEEDKDGNG